MLFLFVHLSLFCALLLSVFLFMVWMRDKRVSVTLFTHNGEPNLNSEQHRISVGQINIHLVLVTILCDA